MKTINDTLITRNLGKIETLLKVVDPDNVHPEHVSDVFHALFDWDPEELREATDFTSDAIKDVSLRISEATRVLDVLISYLDGSLS